MQQRTTRNFFVAFLSGMLSLNSHGVAAQTPETLRAQWAQYEDVRAKNILEI